MEHPLTRQDNTTAMVGLVLIIARTCTLPESVQVTPLSFGADIVQIPEDCSRPSSMKSALRSGYGIAGAIGPDHPVLLSAHQQFREVSVRFDKTNPCRNPHKTLAGQTEKIDRSWFVPGPPLSSDQETLPRQPWVIRHDAGNHCSDTTHG